MLRRLAVPAAVLAAAAALSLNCADAASAQTPQSATTLATASTVYVTGTFTGNGVNIRSGHSTSYVALGAGFKGQKFDISGEWYGSGHTWFYGRNRSTGVKGWVIDTYLYVPSAHTCIPEYC